jgi:threonine/homoserine/homoserine lactone efflux protein
MLGDTVTHIDGHPAELPRVRLRKIYQQGALTNVINPKVAVIIETF